MTAPHERLAELTQALETSFYALLDVCDEYRDTVRALLAEEEEASEPRRQLVHRLRQLSGRIERIIQILEDDALTEMLPMLDRLFAVERAEQGIDI